VRLAGEYEGGPEVIQIITADKWDAMAGERPLVLPEELLTAEFAENGRGGHGEIQEHQHHNLKPAASDLTTDH
jgi:hypothetical protein